MGNRIFSLQLMDRSRGQSMGAAIISAGGLAIVTAAGDPAKATLYSPIDGTALSQPVSLVRGNLSFAVAESVESVDLFIQCPGGQFVALRAVTAGANDIWVDTLNPQQMLVIPFSMDDLTANTETDTGFDEPANAIFLPTPAVRVVTLDATETIAVGTATAASGDPDGFLDDVTVATAVLHKATIANSGNTLGALFEVQDSANAGDLTHEGHVSTAKSIVLLLSAGSDTAEGYVYLPYMLASL